MRLIGAVPLGEWEQEHGGPPEDAGEYQMWECTRIAPTDRVVNGVITQVMVKCTFKVKRKRDGSSSKDASYNEWRK